MNRLNNTNSKTLRKSIHLVTGLLILLLTYLVDKQSLLIIIVAGSVFAFASFNYKTFGLLHKTADASLGTLFYPLGVLLSFVLLYDMPFYFFRITLLILTVSDTIANISGQIKPGNYYFKPFREEKSLYGVIGFALSALLIFYLFLPESLFGIEAYVLLAILLSVNFEVLSYRGSDNFSIPVGSALYFLIMDAHEGNLLFFTGVILISALGSFLLYKKRIISKYGSVATYFLGVYFLGVLGYEWLLPVLAFFVTSVLFTMLNTCLRRKKPSSNRRNVWQVLANINWALAASVLFLISGEKMFIYLFIVMIAAVTADTWASEIGPVFHKNCFSLAHLRMKQSGVSGGISLAGTVAAMLGSLFISGFSYYLFFDEVYIPLIIVFWVSGFLASFVDSLLGAFVEPSLNKQPFLRTGMKKNMERISPNDIVNILGSLSAAVFFFVLYLIVL